MNIWCPICEWRPENDSKWFCECGNIWNTFETKAKCLLCGKQWESTTCLNCSEESPHTDWYHEGALETYFANKDHMRTTQQPNFDVALSFAGADREIVEQVATTLRSRGVSVFYDGFFEAELWGKNLWEYLFELYSNRCRYCVVFISQAYASGDWPRLERLSTQSRSLRDVDEFLLPVLIDDTNLPGLPPIVGYIDLRTHSVSDIAELLCNKLKSCSSSQLLNTDLVTIELRSKFQYEWSNREAIIKIHDSLMELAGETETRLVGCEQTPHRVQLQLRHAAYSTLRAKYLTGELNTATGIEWFDMSVLNGNGRAPAPLQVPLAAPGGARKVKEHRSVVCHGHLIIGLEREYDQAISYLGEKTTNNLNMIQAFVTAKDDRLYVHSNFIKEGCDYPTKIATNLPIDLFTFLLNLAFLELPNPTLHAEAQVIHSRQARYIVDREKIGVRGDEFYAGAMNIRFV